MAAIYLRYGRKRLYALRVGVSWHAIAARRSLSSIFAVGWVKRHKSVRRGVTRITRCRQGFGEPVASKRQGSVLEVQNKDGAANRANAELMPSARR